MRKILLFLTTSIAFSLLTGTIFAQSSKNQSFVTTDMAVKISNYCEYDELMRDIFVSANLTYYNRESDRILRTLDTHLDYAEKFLLSLYNHYGLEKSYFALKNMGFTIQETDIIEDIWENHKDKLTQQANAEKSYYDKKRAEAEKKLEEQRVEEERYWENDVEYALADPYVIDDEKETQQQFDNYIETRVDLNDYFGHIEGTDWNYTYLDDEDDQLYFNNVLKNNGIYWSERLHCYVKKMKNTEEEKQLEKQRQEEQRRQAVQRQLQKEEQLQREQSFKAKVAGFNNGTAFNLAGRSLATTPPKPEYNSKSEGKVIVEIRVDRNGNVVSASPGKAGTTTNDPILREAAKNAALKTKFNSAPNAAEIQVGTITYTFINM